MPDPNCSEGLPMPWWWNWVGMSPPNTGRLIAFVSLAATLIACVALLRRACSPLHVVESEYRPLSREQMRRCLVPGIWTLVVFTALLAAYFASGFYRKFTTTVIGFLAQGTAGMENPAEIAASGIWAATFCAVILGAIAVCWVGARIYWTVACRQTNCVLLRVLCLALVPAAILSLLGKFKLLPAFGSETTARMLCGTWTRNHLGHLGPITDGLNIVAVMEVVIAAASFCLLLWSVRKTADEARTLLSDRSRNGRSRLLRIRPSLARDARSIQDLMDYALYAGAAALVAGLLEVVALLTWSFAPFPSTAELKVQADICKALQPLPGSGTSAPSASTKEACEQVDKQFQTSIAVDDLRRFTRSVGIMFGAVFSALLAAMYLPVAMAQQELVELLARTSPKRRQSSALVTRGAERGPSDLGKNSGHGGKALGLDSGGNEPELDRSMVQRVFNVLAALGPLVVAIVSAVFGL